MARTARALPVQPPSPNALHRATLALRDLREKLIAIDPSIVEDVTLFGDMLDGESNALDVLADMVRAALEAEGWVELMKLRKADLDQRRARYERRSDALRAGVLAVLQDIGLPRLEREDFTASVTGGHRRVIITDDKALPEDLVRTERTPMRKDIGDKLKAGTFVAGAVLSNPEPGLTVKVR